MSPETHLLASWIIAAKTTNNPRDCRLVTLAGVLPDGDGLGILADWANLAMGRGEPYHFYQTYHHYLLHGILGAVLIPAILTCFARDRWRVAGLALLTFHLHLFCDIIGSRGPTPGDLWPICYLEPLHRTPIWFWRGQWPLDGWQNRVITLFLFGWAWRMTLSRNNSVVGVFNRRVDAVVVKVLHKWQDDWRRRFKKPQLARVEEVPK